MKITKRSENKRHPISKELISSLFVLLLLMTALWTYRDSLTEIFEGITRLSPTSLLIFRFVTWILPFMADGILCLAAKLRSDQRFPQR